jgi:hypothetical protein
MIHINFETNSPELLRSQLQALGCTVIAQRPAPSWDGRPPETLVIASSPDWSSTLHVSLSRLSDLHKQDCIAVRFLPNVGATVGAHPVPYKEEYFHVA